MADDNVKEIDDLIKIVSKLPGLGPKSKLKKKTSEEISKVAGIDLPPGFKLPF